MKIQTLHIHPYAIPLTNAQLRSGLFIKMTDEKGNSGWGEVAPLPKWSGETLEDCVKQLYQKQEELLQRDWTVSNYLTELAQLKLLPAVTFGVESALLSLLLPLSDFSVPASALLMGSPKEILEQAKLRHDEGYTSAKLKVSNLKFEEAAHLIHELKDLFRLRVDVNRAWSTSESLQFFSQFPLDTFDYVEEPFQNPHDFIHFAHPLAIDESFPKQLSLEQLERIPSLKALIYKPTIQGGLLGCIALHEWTTKRGISLILSSSFESDLGLAHVASMAYRLSLFSPIGIGTHHYLKDHVCEKPITFSRSTVHIANPILPKTKYLI